MLRSWILAGVCLSMPLLGGSVTYPVGSDPSFGSFAIVERFNQPGYRLTEVNLDLRYSVYHAARIYNWADYDVSGSLTAVMTVVGIFEGFTAWETFIQEQWAGVFAGSEAVFNFWDGFDWNLRVTHPSGLARFAGEGYLEYEVMAFSDPQFTEYGDEIAGLTAEDLETNGSMEGLVTYTFVAVPEPSGLALLGAGLSAIGGMGLFRRRRQRAIRILSV